MSRIKITVDEKCIKYGDQDNIYSCPVARAICKQFNYSLEDELVSVGEGVIEVGSSYYRTPIRVMRKIRKYDKEKIMEPFSFFLDGEIEEENYNGETIFAFLGWGN